MEEKKVCVLQLSVLVLFVMWYSGGLPLVLSVVIYLIMVPSCGEAEKLQPDLSVTHRSTDT